MGFWDTVLKIGTTMDTTAILRNGEVDTLDLDEVGRFVGDQGRKVGRAMLSRAREAKRQRRNQADIDRIIGADSVQAMEDAERDAIKNYRPRGFFGD